MGGRKGGREAGREPGREELSVCFPAEKLNFSYIELTILCRVLLVSDPIGLRSETGNHSIIFLYIKLFSQTHTLHQKKRIFHVIYLFFTQISQ